MADHPQWAALEADNLSEMLADFGTAPVAESYLADDLTWVITGVDDNTYNGVAWSYLSSAEADRVIDETLKHFPPTLPALWHVGGRSQPADLPQRLEAHGCARLRPGVCMVADLSAVDFSSRTIPGLTVERVVDAPGLAAWMDLWMHFDDGPREPRERLYTSLGLEDNRRLRHFLARLNGKPVAISQLFVSQGAAGIYCVATLPPWRKQGIGTAVTLAALREAIALGQRIAVLGPTRESQNMYHRLGFEIQADVGRYFRLHAE